MQNTTHFRLFLKVWRIATWIIALFGAGCLVLSICAIAILEVPIQLDGQPVTKERAILYASGFLMVWIALSYLALLLASKMEDRLKKSSQGTDGL